MPAEIAETLDVPTRSAVHELLQRARDADGWPDVAEDQPLPREFTGTQFVERTDGAVVAYAVLNEAGDAHGRQTAELIVDPPHRRNGHGAELLEAVIEKSTGTLRVWSHAAHPDAAALAGRYGFEPARELLRMRAPLQELPQPPLPDGVELRSFRPGADEAEVVRVNGKAFAWHPEQGALTVADVEATEREPWFDADGFLLATRGDKLLGFHWTKIHQTGGEPVGEVYVVGVDPDEQGSGLGKALTIAGLRHLHQRGLSEVILYVEGDNHAALAVYTKIGFTTESTAIQYELGVNRR